MKIAKVECVSCGAPVQIPSDATEFKCEHCGALLSVERTDGEVALSLVEKLNKSIDEGTRVTREELTKLQLNNELSSLRLQASGLRSEIRSLERAKKTWTVRNQLRELNNEYANLSQQIEELLQELGEEALPDPSGLQAAPRQSGLSAFDSLFPGNPSQQQLGKSCVVGCGTYMLVGLLGGLIAAPLDQFLFHVTSNAEDGVSGPLITLVSILALAAGIFVFVDMQFLGSRYWNLLKEKIRSIRG